MFESAYEAALAFELLKEGLKVKQQMPLPLIYRDVKLDIGYKLDLLVEDKVIVEIKSVEKLTEVHHKQIITYLKLSGKKTGVTCKFQLRRN